MRQQFSSCKALTQQHLEAVSTQQMLSPMLPARTLFVHCVLPYAAVGTAVRTAPRPPPGISLRSASVITPAIELCCKGNTLLCY